MHKITKIALILFALLSVYAVADAQVFDKNQVIVTPYVGVVYASTTSGTNKLFATTSPTVGTITATSTTASSTFGNGINVLNGCYAVSGICLSGGANPNSKWATSTTDATSIYYTGTGSVGVGITAPTAQIDTKLSDGLAPWTLAVSSAGATGSNYFGGTTIYFRSYSYNTVTSKYSATYNEYSTYVATDGDGIYIEFGSGDGISHIERSIDGGTTYDTYLDNMQGGSFVDNGDPTTAWVLDPVHEPVQQEVRTRINYTPDSGTTYYGVYTANNGYFAGNLGINVLQNGLFGGNVGINTATPGSKLTVKNTEHSSAAVSEISVTDSNDREVVGLAAWNGGGGTGGYGSVVTNSYCSGAGCRMGEIGGKNTFNSLRLADMIFETDTAADNGRGYLLTGAGSGAFRYAWYCSASGRCSMNGGDSTTLTTPSAILTLRAGAASTNSAPLKFTSGSLLTTPESGTWEYLSNQFYIRGSDGLSVAGNTGIGTTSPYSKLSVAGQIVAQNYIATSTTATSTFAGALAIGTTTSPAIFDVKGKVLLEPTASTTAPSAVISRYSGQLWNDSLQNQLTQNNGNTLSLGGNLYTATAPVTLNSATPTTALTTSSIGTTTIAANSLRVGQKFTIWGAGYYSTPIGNTATVTITPSIASSTATNISTVTTGIFPASATNLPYDFRLNCTVQAIGSAAKLVCDGVFNYATALTGVSPTSNSLSTVGQITFDSTVKEALDIKVSWSAVTTQTATVQESWIDF